MNLNFNQLTAAAAAAAAGNPGNINMSSFTTAVSNILANSNIDLSQLANLSQLGSSSAALSAAVNAQQTSAASSIQSSRHNLQQAHHHRSSSGSNSTTAAASLSSNTHLTSSISNLANADAATAALSIPGLPSLSNLTSSALADLAASAAAAAAHQTQTGGRNSLPSTAHHRSTTSSSNHHLNHHPSSTTLTAAHQSTSAAKALASAVAHQSQNTTLSHHRNPSSHNAHNSSLNNNNSNNNGISKNNLASLNSSFSSLASLANLNNLNASALGNITNSSLNNIANLAGINSFKDASSSHQHQQQQQNQQQHQASTQQVIIATNNAGSITPPKNSTCYRIGDCVYFEPAPGASLKIGKVDEICRTNGDNSNIEVKLVLFFKRCDISSSLMTLAEKYQYDETQEDEIKGMSDKDKNTLRQRELFYSRQIETIPAAAIRGKCTVQLLNESETLASYIIKEDHYFYTLVYDPQQKTITADRGEIRVGQRYQAEVQPGPIYTPQPGGDPNDPRDLNELETLMFTPDNDLTDDEINKFLAIAKSVGTFARALDCSSSIKQPSLHLTAASASRDVTLLYAMQLLHQNDYDLGKAVCALVPSTGPILCRDEIEEWTAGEATLFEEAIEKYGREFNEIRQDFLPWKSVKNIVEYYYMWKTTDRSIIQRKMKALEAENKVTLLYISDPNNDSKKSPRSDGATKTSLLPEATLKNKQDPDQSPPAKKQNTSVNSSAGATSSSNTATTTKSSNIKLKQESEEPILSTTNSTNEGTNSTLKRRQETEQLRKHTTPGEHIRFIATAFNKKARSELTRKQLRHLSRRPWERRGKSKS